MLTRLDNVTLVVRDLDGALDHYSRLLGRAPSWRGPVPLTGAETAQYRLENMTLELYQQAAEGSPSEFIRDWLERHGEGVLCLGFGCNDAGEAVEWLRAHALDLPEPMEVHASDSTRGAVRRSCGSWIPVSGTRGIPIAVLEDLSPPEAVPPAAPTASEEQIVRALDHVVIGSEDLDATGRLFGDQLGLRLALDRSFEQRGLRMLFFRVGGVTVEVVGRLGSDVRPEAEDRFGGLAWRVDDPIAAHARLRASGFDVSDHRPGHKPGTRVFTVNSNTHGVPTLMVGDDR